MYSSDAIGHHVAGAGFGTDTNVITLISADRTDRLELMSKEDAALRILDRLAELGGFGKD